MCRYLFGGRPESGNSLNTSVNVVTNLAFFNSSFARMLEMTPSQAVFALKALFSRKDPGPGGFYDNLGSFHEQPHLVLGNVTTSEDPSFYRHPAREYSAAPVTNSTVPIEWLYCAQGIYDEPLQLSYPDLEPGTYVMDVVYACDAGFVACNASSATGNFVVHPLMQKPLMRVSSFAIPTAATSVKSRLTLTFTTVPGIGGNGRATQVAEIWLKKK